MNNQVKIIESPRDAWQGLPKQIPTEVKVEALQALISAGFQHLDAVSFVSPKAVPQMADSETVLRLLQPTPETEIIGIVVNEKGAERAIATEAVTTLGFPYSVSPSFLARNQNQTPEESLDVLDRIAELTFRARLELVVYISMAFGNPYGDVWNVEEVVDACDLLAGIGVTQISIADTVGMASADEVQQVVSSVLTAGHDVEIGVHLHARPDQVGERVYAAYDAGCRRFDMAMGGLGGCPFAQDALVGNIATEQAIEALRAAGAALPPLQPLGRVSALAREIARKYGATAQ
ncbi:MAG TPA: hydroxymethylglutaryl-CoA lyase [Acidobacteriaceae bacterium]|nr:hydroxymethylglutaryl-CoA lyase [Acidobacteriaceae bacterium]